MCGIWSPVNATYGQSNQAWNSLRELGLKVDSLQTLLVHASLLAVCCLCVCKWSKRGRRSLEEPGQYTHTQTPVSQDSTPGLSLERLNDEELRQIRPSGQISSMVFLADGKHIAWACKAEKTIRMFNINDHQCEKGPLVNFDADVAVNVVASSKDEQSIVTGDVHGKVVVWEACLQKKRFEAAPEPERHGRMITTLDISGSYIASGSNDGMVVVWEIGEPFMPGRPLTDVEDRPRDPIPVSSVKFSPSGRRIISAYADWGRGIKIWRTRTGDLIKSIRVPKSSRVYSLAWSSDGRRLFTGCYGGSIWCFDMVTQEPFRKVVEPRAGDDSITSLHVSSSGQFLVSFSAPARTVDVWDICDTPARQPLRSYSRCISVCLSPDDLYLATCSSGDDANIVIRNLSQVIETSYIFHRLSPRTGDSEAFTWISPSVHRAWKSGELEQVERILSTETRSERYRDFNHYALANRALVRTRLRNFEGALGDVREIAINHAYHDIPPIAHVAEVMALVGQAKQSNVKDVLRSVPGNGVDVFVEYLKSLILFEVELRDLQDNGLEHTECPSLASSCSCTWVYTRKLLLLANHCIQRNDYDTALQYLASAPDISQTNVQEEEIVQLVFGWNIYDLVCMVEQLRCIALFASGPMQVVENSFQVFKNCLDEDSEASRADLGGLCERLGDNAMHRWNFDKAITWYSTSLRLSPEVRVIDREPEFAKECLSVIDAMDQMTDETVTNSLALVASYPPGFARLFVKRSKALGFKGSWGDALKDADQAIEADELCPWGHERRHAALQALHRYEEAVSALRHLVTRMENSAHPRIRQLYTKYVAPDETIKKIDERIDVIRDTSPSVLIYVKTGVLCNANDRKKTFKTDPTFHKLVSSMSMELDIEITTAKYFRYVMFSHTWEVQSEPTFEDVSEKPVYEPDQNPQRLKLRHFCETVMHDPEEYLWAWSDTCCIQKTVETVYKESIRSMYTWYKESALTIILLAGESTTLEDDKWMTRAWTLQELLAPKSIRIYRRNWELYQGDSESNHKKSNCIVKELAKAIDITQDTLVDFSPGLLGIRDRLRLASTRDATRKVDIAYALIGIFDSHLTPEPREAEDALGLLLAEIVHKECAVKAVLDWAGKSLASRFNSCLPAQISAYQDPPFTSPCIPENEIEDRAAELKALLPQQVVTTFYNKLSELSRTPINFSHGRLYLPCIIFPTSVVPDQNMVDQARAAVLDPPEFKRDPTSMGHDGVLLVYPWIRDLIAQAAGSPSSDEALRFVVHLEQPFRALLLAKQSTSTYRRAVVNEAILIPPRCMTRASLENIGFATLGIR